MGIANPSRLQLMGWLPTTFPCPEPFSRRIPTLFILLPASTSCPYCWDQIHFKVPNVIAVVDWWTVEEFSKCVMYFVNSLKITFACNLLLCCCELINVQTLLSIFPFINYCYSNCCFFNVVASADWTFDSCEWHETARYRVTFLQKNIDRWTLTPPGRTLIAEVWRQNFDDSSVWLVSVNAAK